MPVPAVGHQEFTLPVVPGRQAAVLTSWGQPLFPTRSVTWRVTNGPRVRYAPGGSVAVEGDVDGEATAGLVLRSDGGGVGGGDGPDGQVGAGDGGQLGGLVLAGSRFAAGQGEQSLDEAFWLGVGSEQFLADSLPGAGGGGRVGAGDLEQGAFPGQRGAQLV
jgi:hypothetical protein